MTTDIYIQKNKTEALKKGDKVEMHNCAESKIYSNTLWTCQTDSFIDRSGKEVVFLEHFSGCFLVKYLKIWSKQSR